MVNSLRITLLTIICTSAFLSANDSGIGNWQENLHFDIAAGGYYQNKFISNEILLPSFIQQTRGYNNPPFYSSFNPLNHGCFYMDLNIKLKMAKGYYCYSNFIAEHRGFSYGVYDNKSMVMYPKLRVEIDQNGNLLGKETHFYLSLGNKTNIAIYEGLTIYNLDAQGWDVRLQWDHIRLTYFQINDLRNWIGLNIGEAYDHFLSLEQIQIYKNWKSDIRFGRYDYGTEGFKFSSGFYKNKDFRLYLQGAYQYSDFPDESYKKKSAGLFGFKFRKDCKKLSINSVFEIRGYGSLFNRNKINTNIDYRSPPDNPIFSKHIPKNSYGMQQFFNSGSEYLYPLALYDRPFSQWAVFTEYQDKDVGSIALQLSGKYYIYREFIIRCNLDINQIFAQGEKPFVYPFYTVGVGWEPVVNNFFLIGVSNKGINLDEHYPTFYLYKNPVFHLVIKRII